MPRLAWVTGAGGLIGSHIARAAPRDWNVRGLTHAELDLTDFAAVRASWEQDHPQLIIHCAAISSTTTCEANPGLAWKTNLDATKHLADLAAAIPLLFFSTDLVFDGRKGNYREDDAVNPLSLYAETKVAAEQAVFAHPKHTVIRTALTAGPSPRGDRSFDEQLRLAWQRGDTTRLFVDEFRSPIPALVTARAVWELVAKSLFENVGQASSLTVHGASVPRVLGGKMPPEPADKMSAPHFQTGSKNITGLFHLGGVGRISRFELGRLLAARCPQLHPRIEPISVRDFAGEHRPPDVSLNSSKIQRLLSFPLPRFSEWLHEQASEA